MYLKKTKTLNQTEICTPLFIAALFELATVRWMDIYNVVYTMECYSATKSMKSCHWQKHRGYCTEWNKFHLFVESKQNKWTNVTKKI